MAGEADVTAADEQPRDLTKVGAHDDQRPWTQGKGFKEEKYVPVKARENIRGNIAMCLVWTFVVFVTIVLLIGLGTQLICAWSAACSDITAELKPIKAVVDLILTPLVGLVGAVSGFYFGEKSANARTET